MKLNIQLRFADSTGSEVHVGRDFGVAGREMLSRAAWLAGVAFTDDSPDSDTALINITLDNTRKQMTDGWFPVPGGGARVWTMITNGPTTSKVTVLRHPTTGNYEAVKIK